MNPVRVIQVKNIKNVVGGEMKPGDLVEVTDAGKMYPSYTDKATELGAGRKWKYGYPSFHHGRLNGEKGIIKNIVDTYALVMLNNNHEVVICVVGLKLIGGSYKNVIKDGNVIHERI